MGPQFPGLYRAEVVDTDLYAERGRITIRIFGLQNEDTHEEAYVLNPFGGLPNMGSQFLPPIGAVGYVIFEKADDRFPVWMGAVSRYWGKEMEDGYGHPVEAEDPTDFVIKTQYTTKNDQDVDSPSNKVENVLKMNEEALTIAKYHQTDQYTYEKEAYDPDDSKAINLIQIKDDQIKIKVRTEDNSDERVLIINGDQILLEWGPEQNVTIEEDRTVIKSGGSDIEIDAGGTVTVNSDKIVLKGESGTGVFYEMIRDFVNQAYNSHTHGTPAGPSGPPVTPFTATSTGESKHVKLS